MKIENGTLVMAVDGAKLLLFRNDGDAKYPVLSTLAHEELENPATREQGSDAPGRTQHSTGDGRASSYGDTDWHEQAEQRFVAHAAVLLESSAGDDREAGIVVIAPARALGELRKHYGRQTKERLIGELGKDLAGHTTDDIVKAISAHRE